MVKKERILIMSKEKTTKDETTEIYLKKLIWEQKDRKEKQK